MIKIKNGIITDFNIKGIAFKLELIPENNIYARPGYKMQPQHITTHNTGDPGATAEQISNYVRNQRGYKSWQITIGNNVVIQQLPIIESGWHAGDGANGVGNRKSIGIEICEVAGAEETAIKFFAELLEVTNIPILNITTHKNWSGKNCPRLILPHWELFIKNIEMELIKLKDIKGRWSEKEINEALKDGVFSGYPDGTFKPEEPLTREQAAVLYVRIKNIIKNA